VTATVAALAGAALDVRRAWDARASLCAAAVAVAALLPLAVSTSRLTDLAAGLYLAVAATGLGLAVGVAGMPSLAQGAFMGVGAFTAAQLRIHAGVPTLVAALGGAAAAAAAGAVTGVGFVRLQRGLVAVSTWILAWLVWLALGAFPSLSGGARGLLLPSGPSTAVHYELALALVAATALGLLAISRGPVGLRLVAARERRAAAEALGVPVPRLRLEAFVASAAVGGLAGGLSVQLAEIADATAFGPYLSFKLFVAVLIGGAASAAGPFVGVAVLGLVSLAADAVGSLEDVSSARFHPLLSAVLLLAVLSLGGEGIVRAPRRLRHRWVRRPCDTVSQVPAPVRNTVSQAAVRESDTVSQARLCACGLSKRYGDLVALEGLDLEVVAGEVTALIGPNGSGKTTALRLLAGAERPDAGTIRAPGPVTRTLQATATFGDLTALDHMLVGAAGRRRYGGFLRTLLATPKAREEDATAVENAHEVLRRFGLGGRGDTPASELGGSDQRLLMIAAAYATGASVLLLDEPSAGAAAREVERLADVLTRLRDEGLAILFVEHNLALVRAVADRVVALDAGRVIARGSAERVGDDPDVRAAYLGRHTL
jgi:branched-chain amino acid transport system ATP-binding protein/branched-chain amino acid transport system permease protein